jgi:hypothetical protein
MAHIFFISHHSGDKNIAELFSDALQRISLDQINAWFSSDDKSGGLKPGDIWFNQILSKITQSKAVVTLLTPNSINRPWVYFESGIGQALENCEVIPVCIGVKKDDISHPLDLYQCYQLNDYRSIVDFFSKLLTLFSVRFDEEMSRVVIEKLVSDFSKIQFNVENSKEKESETIEKIIENFKNHIDKRFLEIMEKSAYQIIENNLNLKIKENEIQQIKRPLEVSYSVSFDIDFPKFKNENLYIDIRQDDTFQDVTNTLYFMLKEYVPIYTYLEEWIIVEHATYKHVVIREVADKIPAKAIFKPNTKWKIVKLDKPYNALNSYERVRHRR